MSFSVDHPEAQEPTRSERKLRLLWLIKGLGPGGAENLLVQHARARGSGNDELTVAYTVAAKSQLVEPLERTGAKVVLLAAGWAGIRQLRALLRSADVVHTHSPVLASLVRTVARTVSPRPRLVYTEHNRWQSYRRPTRWANRATFRLDDVSLAVSEDSAASMSVRAKARTKVIRHGIDIAAVQARASRESARDALRVGPDELVVGIVANCREEKDLQNLVGAVEHLRFTWPTSSVRVVHIGQGPLADRFAEWHDESTAGPWLRRLGHRPEAVDLMAGFDVVTLSSRHEGLPVVLMEAAALGLPIVAPDVGGVSAICRENLNGILVPAQDPTALADAWRWMEEHPGRRGEMGAASLRIAREFDVSRSVNEIEAAYGVGR